MALPKEVMREVFDVITESTVRIAFSDFSRVQPNDFVEPELLRLISDGLIEGEIRYDRFGTCQAEQGSLFRPTFNESLSDPQSDYSNISQILFVYKDRTVERWVR